MTLFHSLHRGGSRGFSAFFILQGGLLMVLGILILLFPALLQVMVASFFILIGILVLGFGLTVRKLEHRVTEQRDPFVDV